MDLQRSLANAHMVRVAIVDDDLSNRISTANLRLVDDNLEALLEDLRDQDRQAYIEVLRRHNYVPGELHDLAEPLSDQAVRDEAPERLRLAAEQILDARRGNAEPVLRVKQLLIESGILPQNIFEYFAPAIPADTYFDLMIVDYFLVDDDTTQTIPFIEGVVHQHAHQENPLQLILMSSHEEGLRQNFRDLRPRASVSSSRMRILAKPREDTHLSGWKLTLEQLATDRSHVKVIESFVDRAVKAMRDAAEQQSRKLWELDLQAMKLLHEVAEADHDDFRRHVEECLSRMLLTRLEELHDLREALERLQDQFGQNGNSALISAGSEIGDSRAAIRELMTSMVWRGGGAPRLPPFPEDVSQRAPWVQRALRFGMVVQEPAGPLWLNLTQSCDLAQADPEELPHLSLLFVRGQSVHPSEQAPEDRGTVRLSGAMVSTSAELITWQLRRSMTLSVAEFTERYANDWTIVGELRPEQAQSIVNTFGAQTTRVGLQRSVRSWGIRGVALTAASLRDAAEGTQVEGFVVTGQAVMRGKDYQLHFELATYDALQAQFPGNINDTALRLCSGISVKPGKASPGEPYLFYSKVPFDTVEKLRAQVDRQLLQRAENANKVILIVWAA